MRSAAFSYRVALLALGVLLSGLLRAAEETPGFRRFASTLSPDGAYVLAWGWGEDADNLAALKEWPVGQDRWAEDGIGNFLVDAVQGRLLAKIDEHNHYVTTDGHWKRFSGLAVGWAEDSQRGLAIYGGRFGDDSILWINPKKRTFVEVLEPLQKAYFRFLTRKEKLGDEPVITFSLPALLPGGVLVIDARAQPKVNEPLEYNYRLKFQVKFDGEEPKCLLVSGRKVPAAPDAAQVESELNAAYQQLRARLNDAGRAALKEKQLQWLKLREAMADDSARKFFTRLRTAYLRARAEN